MVRSVFKLFDVRTQSLVKSALSGEVLLENLFLNWVGQMRMDVVILHIYGYRALPSTYWDKTVHILWLTSFD